MRIVAEVRNQGRHHRVNNTGEKGTRANNERVRIDERRAWMDLSKRTRVKASEVFFSEAKEHTVEEVKRDNGAETAETKSASL